MKFFTSGTNFWHYLDQLMGRVIRFLSFVCPATAIFFVHSVCLAGTLSMEDAVREALGANPELAASVESANAKDARAPQAATPPDPMFMVDFQGVPTNTADVSKGTVMYMVEQQIPFPSKLVFGYKAEKRAADALFSKKNAVALELIRAIKRAWLDLWRIEEEERIGRETLAIYAKEKASTNESYATLKSPVADSVRASVDLGEVEGRLALLQAERLSAIAALEKMLARPVEPDIRLPGPPPIPSLPPLDELIANAKEKRPEIEEATNMVKSESAGLSLAKSQFAPDFVLRWGFMDSPAGMPNAWYGRAGISIPIWSFSKQRFGVRESRAMLARAQLMKDSVVLSTEVEIKTAHAKFVAAKKASDIYAGTVVPRARLLVRSSEEGYRSGKGSFLNVVDSIRSLNDAQLMQVRSRADAAGALADLERAVGESF